jgi:predicted dehydrogenase
VRQHILYYDPVIKAKNLIEKNVAGRLVNLKLLLKVTGIKNASLDRGNWLIENETSCLALAEYFFGPVQKVYARLEPHETNGIPCSNVVVWKYCERHQYGYLQVDFTPGLHVRTFTDPIFRAVEITGNDGKIFINRAEGQLLRQPVLLVRTRDRTIVHELVKDDWREVYPAMAKDMINSVISGKLPGSTAESSRNALQLALAAKASSENGQEFLLD